MPDGTGYVIEAEQGRGGMGRVLRARDRRLGRSVAIKELLHADAINEARFARETMLTARLQHPSIVAMYEAGRWPDGRPYYAMKLVEGQSLKQLIAGAHTLDDRLALLPHVLGVAEAIAYAHRQRVIHRDLKPANIIVGEFGESVVHPLGTRQSLDDEDQDDAAPEAGPYRDAPDERTAVGGILGTPAYMPPEQAAAKTSTSAPTFTCSVACCTTC